MQGSRRNRGQSNTNKLVGAVVSIIVLALGLLAGQGQFAPPAEPQTGRAPVARPTERVQRPTATVRRQSASPAATRPTVAPPQSNARSDGLPTISYENLPREAQRTMQLIQQGGPFPYEKDDTVFGNREGLLPSKPRGYYREYTVVTPGENDRGARRIVAGENGELFYTDDHYESFRRIK